MSEEKKIRDMTMTELAECYEAAGEEMRQVPDGPGGEMLLEVTWVAGADHRRIRRFNLDEPASAFREACGILPPWYKRIPEKGVLCWVWDEAGSESRARVVLVIGYDPAYDAPFRVRDYRRGWKRARPLTREEALARVVSHD